MSWPPPPPPPRQPQSGNPARSDASHARQGFPRREGGPAPSSAPPNASALQPPTQAFSSMQLAPMPPQSAPPRPGFPPPPVQHHQSYSQGQYQSASAPSSAQVPPASRPISSAASSSVPPPPPGHYLQSHPPMHGAPAGHPLMHAGPPPPMPPPPGHHLQQPPSHSMSPSAPPPPHGMGPPPPAAPPPPPSGYPAPPPPHPSTTTHHPPPPYGGGPPPPPLKSGTNGTHHAPPPRPPLVANGVAPTTTAQPPPPSWREPKPRIDPSQIPRPPLFTRPQNYGEEAIPLYYAKRTLQQQEVRPPPAADSRFVALDDGNAIPQIMRSSVYCMPTDKGVLRKVGHLDLGLICTPLSIDSADRVPPSRRLPHDETQDWRDPMCIPVEDSTVTPPRCSHCAAYVNPFWNVSDGSCNFCGTKNKTVPASGLCFSHGTLEYTVAGPYVTRPTPVAPVFLYAIDATCPQLESYISMLKEVGMLLAQQWARQGRGAATGVAPRIGCSLVGSFGMVLVHRQRPGEELQLTVASDVTVEPFCPLPLEEWTHDVSTEEGLHEWIQLTSELLEAWQPFLESLGSMTPYGRRAADLSCGGAALAFLSDALAASGGRGTLISWRRPNLGVGAIRDREAHDSKLYVSSASERRLYTPLQLSHAKLFDKADRGTAQFYQTLGETCARNRVALDIVMHTLVNPAFFLDVGTLGELCRTTTGKFKWIRSRDWKEEMQEELRRPVLFSLGGDAVFKLRCSTGMRVKSYMSGTAPGVTIENVMSDSPELELATVAPDTTIAVLLEHKIGGLSNKSQMVYFQSALLYTTNFGQRRVRVSTLGLRTSSNPANVFRSIDFLATTALLTRQAVLRVWKPPDDEPSPLRAARSEMTSRCMDFLAAYRLNTTAHSLPPGQLILPDRLQLLPLFVMSILKSTMLRPSLPKRASGYRATHPSPTADERAFSLCYGAAVSPAMSMLSVHANVFPLLDLEDKAGEWQMPHDASIAQSELEHVAHHAYIQLPPSVHPSISCLEDDCIYVVDDGVTLYVLVGKDVGSDVTSELLQRGEHGPIMTRETESGQRAHRLIWQMRTFSSVGPGSESNMRPTVGPVVVVLSSDAHRDPYEERIMNLMVDDSTSNEKDYMEFLCDLHADVRKMVETGIKPKPSSS